MTEIIHEYRGKLLENIHHGRIAVVNDQGKVLYAVGEPEALTYYRSASKPLQALPVLERHLEEKYGLTNDEIVIMAGSHAGEDIHLNAILGMLEKAGFAEEDMVMLPTLPANEEVRRRMLCQNLPGRKALHNCAGKHTASMMLARFFGEEYKSLFRIF